MKLKANQEYHKLKKNITIFILAQLPSPFMRTLVLLAIYLTSFFSFTSNVLGGIPPSAAIKRTVAIPHIDGRISEGEWINATLLSGFRQFEPVSDAEPSFETKVMLMYDDEAVYVAAIMYDPAPDSIARQLGERDNDDLNADYFGFAFDTYNNQQDAYYFAVSASGIQVDGRMLDETYSAVWYSEVGVTDSGWIAEVRIPYSAIRFPGLPTQDWGFQASRTIRRYREQIHWALEEKGAGNVQVHWGKLTGFENIRPPLRLSFTPYISANMQHNSDPAFRGDPWSFAYNGGMDLKYGINESFTLDMILLPDFSQVQSDKIQKNLTALELIYDENRTFFNEGTDLFNKGELFYSRRIGRTPLRHYMVSNMLDETEVLTHNPVSARLLNAMKFSGRTGSGLGIGVFNAVTGNTWATAKDTASGNEREILTDPATNYNIVVLDQALPNNSSVYFINTNVTRPGGWDDSNVTGAGTTIGDKSKTYFVGMNFSASKWNKGGANPEYSFGETSVGYNYGLFLMKSRGKFQFSVYQSALDSNYNINDLGINRYRNQQNRGVYVSYRLYEPFGIFLNFAQSLGLDQTRALNNKTNINTLLTYKGNTTLRNYFTFWWGISVSPTDRYDYYEPRIPGRYFLKPGYNQGWIGFSSDYRKKLAIDGQFYYTREYDKKHYTWFEIGPVVRLNDRLSFRQTTGLGNNPGDLGFIGAYNNTVWFGKRDVNTLENSFSGKYMISRLISTSLWFRHFWQTADYKGYYTLNTDGTLTPDPDLVYDANFNYNFFSIDLAIGWEFAPGSMLSLVWKNNIESEDKAYNIKYLDNLDQLFNASQLNMFSIKALYHLDYLMLKRRKP